MRASAMNPVRRWGVRAALVIATAVAALALAACAALTEASDPFGAKVGDLAPNFALETTTGARVELADYRGHPVMLYFWASWCGSCVFDLPAIDAVSRAEASDGLVTITVNVGEDLASVERFLQKHVGDYAFLAAIDPTLRTFRTYRILSFPMTFFVDRDGLIQRTRMGRISAETLSQHLEALR